MTAQRPDLGPLDVAAAYPHPPVQDVAGRSATAACAGSASPAATGTAAPDPTEAALAGRLDGTDPGPAEVVLSAERLTAGTEWTVSGAVRFRRRIATYTRTVEVTVRREELQVEFRDVAERDGAWVGTEYRGPAVAAPPVVTGPGVFTLREEIPDVMVRVVPYERVVVEIDRVTEQVQLVETARREQATVSGDTGAALPPARR